MNKAALALLAAPLVACSSSSSSSTDDGGAVFIPYDGGSGDSSSPVADTSTVIDSGLPAPSPSCADASSDSPYGPFGTGTCYPYEPQGGVPMLSAGQSASSLCCPQDSVCLWSIPTGTWMHTDVCAAAPPGQIMLGLTVHPMTTDDGGVSPVGVGATAVTLTSPPFHGICFYGPNAVPGSVPMWCEALKPTGSIAGSGDVDVELSPQLAEPSPPAFSPPAVSLCYLDGTLATTAKPGCMEASAGGYCCYPPEAMYLDLGTGGAIDSWASMPDLSNDGP